MGGTKIKNLIIIALVAIVVTETSVGFTDILNYISMGLDKLQEIVYSMKRSV